MSGNFVDSVGVQDVGDKNEIALPMEAVDATGDAAESAVEVRSRSLYPLNLRSRSIPRQAFSVLQADSHRIWSAYLAYRLKLYPYMFAQYSIHYARLSVYR